MASNDMSLHVQASMAEVVERLQKLYPDMEFFFAMVPFHESQIRHLSKAQKNELEKRVTRAATGAFWAYLRSPDRIAEP